MERSRIFESVVGFFVLVLSAWFFVFAYNKTKNDYVHGYRLFAKFDNADGVVPGAEVRLGGVKVGVVEAVTLDYDAFMANVTFVVNEKLSLPSDTEATISSASLLGGKYVALNPGVEDERLKENGEIVRTRGGQSLEGLISQYLLSGKDKSESE